MKQTVQKINTKGIKFMKHKFLEATALPRTIVLKNTLFGMENNFISISYI